jgi:predicted ATPase
VETRRRLLERDEALRRLADAVASASRGAGRVALVAGEAGVGKTTLVRRFAEEAGGGLRVLRGACDDLTVPQPLAPIRDIGDEAGEPLEGALSGADLHDVGQPLREELARETPTLCVIEDCHWADEATLDVISHVARRIGRLGSVLALTLRDDELALDHRLRAVAGAIAPEDVVRISLEPLSSAGVAELAGPDADAHALFAATGGNP